MYRFQAVILSFLISFLAIPPIQAQQPLSTESLYSGKLTIGAAEFPPYEFSTEDHQIQGFSAELIDLTLVQMNINSYHHRMYPWKRALESTYTGKIHAIHSTSKNEERKELLWFPDEPLVNSAKVFAVRNNNKQLLNYQSFDDLKGRTVGMIRGYNFPGEFWHFLESNNIKYFEVTHETQLFNMFKAGRFDFLADEIIVLRNMIRNHEDEFTILEHTPIQVKPMYLAFSKASVNKQFVDDFSKALKAVKQTPEYALLCKQYQVLCTQPSHDDE
ncbi:substrate-binding periplasmic protein [Litoribrevibacter euphylliae]|uniref:Substrate-binding periplasmic protein n=1 Tax=Litoribrevibacter euphylliae TaxID=1834034 RepID=A0ABV7HJ70_9GAMM